MTSEKNTGGKCENQTIVLVNRKHKHKSILGAKKASACINKHPKCQKKQQKKSDIIFTRNKINRARKSTGEKKITQEQQTRFGI